MDINRLSPLVSASAATVSVGIPEDIERGVIQLAVGLLTYFLTKLFNRLNKKDNGK